MLVSAERGGVRLISLKLFPKNFNPYDHDTLTLQTDRRTDGRTGYLASQYSATLCFAR